MLNRFLLLLATHETIVDVLARFHSPAYLCIDSLQQINSKYSQTLFYAPHGKVIVSPQILKKPASM